MNTLNTLKIVIISTILIFGSCKKEEEKPEPLELQLEKNGYYPFEITQAEILNTSLSESSYQGDINGNSITLQNVEGVLVFMMPDLQTNSYTLNVQVNGTTASTTFNIKNFDGVSIIPDSVLADVRSQQNLMMQQITDKAAILGGNAQTLLMDNVQLIMQWNSDLDNQYASLTSDQKINCAKLILANQWWQDEIYNGALSFIDQAFSYRNSSISDYDRSVTISMGQFVFSKAKVIKHIPKLIVLVGVLGLIGNVPGAAIGAGIAIGLFLSDCNVLETSIENVLDKSIQPIENTVNVQRSSQSSLSFDHNQFKNLTITMDYRSLYLADKTSSIPIVKSFVNGMVEIRNAWNKIIALLPASLFSLNPPVVIDDVQNFDTQNRQIYSDYLQITNISNSNVLLDNIDRSNGELRVRFNSTSNVNQTFSFDVEYDNPGFGKYTQTFNNATLIPDSTVVGDSLSIIQFITGGNSKNWIFDPAYYIPNCCGMSFESDDVMTFDINGLITVNWGPNQSCPDSCEWENGPSTETSPWYITRSLSSPTGWAIVGGDIHSISNSSLVFEPDTNFLQHFIPE